MLVKVLASSIQPKPPNQVPVPLTPLVLTTPCAHPLSQGTKTWELMIVPCAMSADYAASPQREWKLHMVMVLDQTMGLVVEATQVQHQQAR